VTPAGTQIAAVDSSPAPAPGPKAPQPPVAPPTKRAETKVASSQTKTPASRTERSTSAAPERTVSRPAASAEAGLATMRLIVNPPATLFIDNVSKGQQSRYSEQLIPGTHTVRVERDGWITKDTTVTISAGQPATIRINLTERP
jgi:hypothetical protein